MTREPFTCPLCGHEGDFETADDLPDTIECDGCGRELGVEYWMAYAVYPKEETKEKEKQ